WTLSNSSVASLDVTNGVVTVTATADTGSTQVTASLSGVSGSATFTVSAPILSGFVVMPDTASVAVGLTRQFTATGTFTDGTTLDVTSQVTWSVSDSNVASISNAAGSRGLATGVSAGPTTVTATATGGLQATASLTVTDAVVQSVAVSPGFVSVPNGQSQTYT